jgi:hypothetical protein
LDRRALIGGDQRVEKLEKSLDIAEKNIQSTAALLRMTQKQDDNDYYVREKRELDLFKNDTPSQIYMKLLSNIGKQRHTAAPHTNFQYFNIFFIVMQRRNVAIGEFIVVASSSNSSSSSNSTRRQTDAQKLVFFFFIFIKNFYLK